MDSDRNVHWSFWRQFFLKHMFYLVNMPSDMYVTIVKWHRGSPSGECFLWGWEERLTIPAPLHQERLTASHDYQRDTFIGSHVGLCRLYHIVHSSLSRSVPRTTWTWRSILCSYSALESAQSLPHLPHLAVSPRSPLSPSIPSYPSRWFPDSPLSMVNSLHEFCMTTLRLHTLRS